MTSRQLEPTETIDALTLVLVTEGVGPLVGTLVRNAGDPHQLVVIDLPVAPHGVQGYTSSGGVTIDRTGLR